jgi:hypothetical protein
MLDKVFKLKVYTDSPESAAEILRKREDYERFFIYEDEPICSLEELAKKLRQLDPAKYLYHANQEKNDFAMWVRAVLGDGRLADHLIKAKNKKQAVAYCDKRLSELKDIVKKK